MGDNVKDDAVMFDLDALTFQDLEDFEDATGQDLMAVAQQGGTTSAKALAALVWIAKRQHDPDLTLDAVKRLKVSELAVVFPEAEEADEVPSD